MRLGGLPRTDEIRVFRVVHADVHGDSLCMFESNLVQCLDHLRRSVHPAVHVVILGVGGFIFSKQVLIDSVRIIAAQHAACNGLDCNTRKNSRSMWSTCGLRRCSSVAMEMISAMTPSLKGNRLRTSNVRSTLGKGMMSTFRNSSGLKGFLPPQMSNLAPRNSFAFHSFARTDD